MTRLGDLVATGRTSDVYAFGRGVVVKVPRPHVPDHWAGLEAEFTAAVRALGVPAPGVVDLTEIDGRDAIVFERIEGCSMWEHMLGDPARIPELAIVLADAHRRILSAGPGEGESRPGPSSPTCRPAWVSPRCTSRTTRSRR